LARPSGQLETEPQPGFKEADLFLQNRHQSMPQLSEIVKEVCSDKTQALRRVPQWRNFPQTDFYGIPANSVAAGKAGRRI
jgi:hypothetical protein